MPKEETVRTCTHIHAVAPLGKSWLYNNWGYGLATEIIEQVSGQNYGVFVKKRILEPLQMGRTTFDTLAGDNVVEAHMTSDDGTPCRVPPPPMTTSTPLAGAGGAKSTIRDLLIFYKSLMDAYHNRSRSQDVPSQESPLRHVDMLFTPQIGIAGSNQEEEGYALGWVRALLPRQLSVVGKNDAWLGHSNVPVTGEKSVGKAICTTMVPSLEC